MYFSFPTLLSNVALMARQTPGRVRCLRARICVLGDAGEQWDERRQVYCLPTPLEYFTRVWASLNGPHPRRPFTQREMRQIWRAASRAIRIVRQENITLN